MVKEHFKLASKNLRRRGTRSWLTMLGIFIGIAAVVALISLGDGLRTTVTGQLGTLGPDRLTVQNSGTGFGPPGSTSVRKLTSHDINIIKNVNGVELVSGRLVRMIKLEYNDASIFSYSTSLPDDKIEVGMTYDTLDIKLLAGNLLNAGETGKVILGNDFSKDTTFGKAIQVGNKISIQGKSFVVKGIMQRSSSVLYNGIVIISEKDLRDVLNIGDEYDIIGVKVKSDANPQKVASAIEDALRKDRHEKVGEEDFQVTSPIQSLQSVNTIVTIINIIVTGIAAISLIVGGIGIANTMYTSVLERTREIGIMKAIGAKNFDILLIFLIEAGLLGLIGGLVGAAFGLGFALLVAFVAKSYAGIGLTITISWSLLIFSVAFSFLLGTASGVTPALQASRLKPTEALRA